ncbi:MAG TPA: ammonium transporter [bacterium]|nr:ammonium transporter [bacterium]
MKRAIALIASLAVVFMSDSAMAEHTVDSLPVSAGDTSFVLMSAALVLFMTVGLAFFYGGLVRRKNILSILMQCFFVMCLLSVQWILFGYTLSFGPDKGGIIGGLDWIGLRGVGLAPSPDYGSTVPQFAFMVFQGMFAVITPALIVGAFAERMKFSAFCVFSIFWAFLVYNPVCHWVWGAGGFLAEMGALDFAGGTVVHINAGIAALVIAIVLGKRAGYPGRSIPPHNLPFTVLGAGILWFGWFGFNAGSALAADGIAAGAFVATNSAAAAAGITWALIEWIREKNPTTLGTATGAVAGLVAVTPAAGFVGPVSAMIIGAGSSILGYIAVAYIKPALGYDDSLDAFGVHGVGGIWGALATGLFASTAVNPGGANGLFMGNPKQLWLQFAGVAVTIIYSLIVTFIIAKLVDKTIGLRAELRDEQMGLDLTQHHESGYTVLD